MTDTTELRRRLREALFTREQWTVKPMVRTDRALSPLESAENDVRTLTFELLDALDAEDAEREARQPRHRGD